MIELKIKVGMPHLNYNGLDPIWLSKTLGDCHWGLLNNVKTTDNQNQRLYASFFACEIDFNKGQNYFYENDDLHIQSKLFKFNNLIYSSSHLISSNKNVAKATFDSIFVKKDKDTNSLVKSEPKNSIINIESINSVFIEEHKKIKKKLFEKNNIAKFNKLIFSPEAYFNGVKILYFANYINLVMLNEFISYNQILPPIKKLKIFYFKNINWNDEVYGYTSINETSGAYETILVSNNIPIAFCIIDR